MKVVRDFKSFCKIKRKYYKRHTIRRTDVFNGKRYTSYWEYCDWLGYVVKTYDEFKQKTISGYILWMIGPVAFCEVKKGIEKLFNASEVITFKSEDKTYTGYFRGVMITNRDATYLLEDAETKENLLIPMHWLNRE